MIQSVLTVAEKVLILFLMMGVGYGCFRKRMITSRGALQLTNLVLYVVGPCLIIAAFQTDSKEVSLQKILVMVSLFVLGQVLVALASRAVFRKQENERANLLRFGVFQLRLYGHPLGAGPVGRSRRGVCIGLPCGF